MHMHKTLTGGLKYYWFITTNTYKFATKNTVKKG